jgi:hypothetical protein
VKTIIKFFIAVIVVHVFAVLYIEDMNAINTANSLNQTLRLSVKKACEYYGQETYKTDASGMRGNMPNVYGDGGAFVSGEFYGGSTPEAVFASLYSGSADFAAFVNDYSGVWDNLNRYKNMSASGNELFGENLITPLNQGITYLDREAVEKIARWNFASNLAVKEDGDGAVISLRRDKNGEACIEYAGFYIYPDSLKLSADGWNYTLCDLGTASGQSTFRDLTYIEPTALWGNAAAGDMERTKVMLIDVDFTVDVSYHGITGAFQKVMEFMQDSAPDDPNTDGVAGIEGGEVHRPHGAIDIDKKQSYTNKGLGQRGVTGKLIYYVVR